MALQSFFAQLLQALIKHISSAVPEIRWVDQDFGQLEHYEDRPPVAFPCVLIDFTTTSFEDEIQHVQWGNCTINFRLAFAPFSQSSNTAPQQVQEKALQYFELENKLYQALQSWYPDSEICQPLTRVSVATENREDPLRVRTLSFTTAFEDTGAKKVYTKVPRPALEEEYEKTII